MRGLTCSPQAAPGNKVRDQGRVISMVCQVRLDPTQSGFIVQIPRIDGGSLILEEAFPARPHQRLD